MGRKVEDQKTQPAAASGAGAKPYACWEKTAWGHAARTAECDGCVASQPSVGVLGYGITISYPG